LCHAQAISAGTIASTTNPASRGPKRPAERDAATIPLAAARAKKGSTKIRWRDSGAEFPPNRPRRKKAVGVITTQPVRSALRGRLRACQNRPYTANASTITRTPA
jgi:hypothetical protein